MKKLKSTGLLGMAGILFILTGIFCFVDPLRAYVELVRFSGLFLILKGIVLQLASASAHIKFIRERRYMQIESIVDFIFGILLIFNPFMTFILYPLLIGYWILSVAVLKMVIAIIVRKLIRGWLFILAIGLLFFVFALLIINAPSTRAKDITLYIGILFIVLGAVLTYDSTKLKRMHETIDLLI